MKLSLEKFLKLKFRHEYHDFHNEGNKCIYQDLIKNKKTIRDILFCIQSDPEYLNADKYNRSSSLKYDHMNHYINCILYGFRKNIIEWRSKDSNGKLANKDYYQTKEIMSDDEVRKFLSLEKIKVDKDLFVYDGYHRCFCMIGRILNGQRYIPFVVENSFKCVISYSKLIRRKRRRIKNIGYRPKDNKSRLRLINNNIDTSNFTLLDVGSNFGYFSLSISEQYPNSTVYSVEGSFGTGNENAFNTEKKAINKTDGIRSHYKIKNEYRIFNNHILCMLLTDDVIKSLLQRNIRFDYQLSLSVFHWIAYEKFGNNGRENNLHKLLYDHISLANTTFIELPDINQETSLSSIYKKHSSVKELLLKLKKTYNPNMNIMTLAKHEWYGTRYLFKITIDGMSNAKANKEELINICRPMHVY